MTPKQKAFLWGFSIGGIFALIIRELVEKGIL